MPESDKNILATSDEGVAKLVAMVKTCLESADHKIEDVFSAKELVDCLNHLAINDDNKHEIQKEGGIPLMIHMLTDDFDVDEQQVAAKALWNMAFIESIKKSTELQEAVPCK